MISNNQQTSPAFPSPLAVPNAGSGVPAPASNLASQSAGDQQGNPAPERPAAGKNFQQHMQDSGESSGNSRSSGSSGSSGSSRDASESSASSQSASTVQQKPRQPASTATGETKETKPADSDSAQKSVLGQIMRQIIKQNPDAKPEALAFLQGQVNEESLARLPAMMTASRFVADVLIEADIGAFMSEDVKPSAVLRELGFSPDMVTQALSLGIDGGGAMSRGAVLAALGAQPAKVTSVIDSVKASLTREGVSGYMQQALALAKASGKSPDLLESLAAVDVEDASSDLVDFKNQTSLEVQAVMAQALSASGSWAPRHMTAAKAPQLDAPAVMPATSLAAPATLQPEFSFQPAASAPADAENMRLLEFATRLQAEFGDDVRIIGVGEAAWDQATLAGNEQPIEFDPVDSSVPLVVPGEPVFTADADGMNLNLRAEARQGLEKFSFEQLKPVAADEPLQVKMPGFSAKPESTLAQMTMDAAASGESSKALKFNSKVDSGQLDVSLLGDSLTLNKFADAPQSGVEVEREIAVDQVSPEVRDMAVFAPVNMTDASAVEVTESPSAAKAERVESTSRQAVETVQKIQDAIRRTAVSDIGAMRLDLSSPETGNLEIAVRVDSDQQVDVRVMAASGELRELLARELPQLKSTLGEQNLNLRDVDVQAWAGMQGDGQFSGQGRHGAWREQLQDQLSNAAGRIASGFSGISPLHGAATSSIDAIKGQMGRQALRSFKILDMSDRQPGGAAAAGRIQILA